MSAIYRRIVALPKSHSILGLRQFGEVFIQKGSWANQEELREGADANLRAARLRLGKPERERRTATARQSSRRSSRRRIPTYLGRGALRGA